MEIFSFQLYCIPRYLIEIRRKASKDANLRNLELKGRQSGSGGIDLFFFAIVIVSYRITCFVVFRRKNRYSVAKASGYLPSIHIT